MAEAKTLRKTNVHLLCNAHLDPIWVWQWEEGLAETLSTFRSAADLCEKGGHYIFNHNEVILYKWVQDYEPALFKRIQKLVKQGKWHIMGGWYLQPDCNMPSGESLVRHIFSGRKYFKDHFNVEPTTAMNFDPFGHSRGLVQILAKCDYDSYLFGRPDQNDCPLPADEFVWVGYDGSEVMATRFSGWYNSPLGKAREKIEQWLKDNPDKKHCLILWGVGNHGGGPSRIDIRNINQLIKQNKTYNIEHSTPETFFKELSIVKDTLPRHKKDLNPWAIGCYTSQSQIKQKQRQLENAYFMTEKMASAASVQKLMSYPHLEFQEALEALMFGQFHDVLPGSSIQPAEKDGLNTLGHGLELISRIKARAFIALSSGEPKARPGTIPIMVYNPHPYPIKQLVECEFNLPDSGLPDEFTPVLVYQKGKRLPCQVEHEISHLGFDWRKRVVFQATLEPSQMNRFDCRLEPTISLSEKPKFCLKPQRDKIHFKTKDLDVIINTQTGFLDRYRVKGIDYVAKNTFEPLVMKDKSDSWRMVGKSFRDIAGRFKLMSKKAGTKYSGVEKGMIDSVRVIEEGPVRCVIEAVFSYGHSFICQQYKLPCVGTEIEVETRVHWNEKDRMLKLSIPTVGRESQYLGQVVYGVGELPTNGYEAVAQKWVAVVSRKDDLALTCINDSTYGSDFSEDGLRLSLLRSPVYSCSHWADKSLLVTDRYTPRMDQGERLYRFWFNAGKVTDRLNRIDREALVKNETPFVLSFFPAGQGKKLKALVTLSDPVVQIPAVKKTGKGDHLIIRLFEPTGRNRTTLLTLPFLVRKVKLNLKGFEIKTLRVNLKTGKITEVNLLERAMR